MFSEFNNNKTKFNKNILINKKNKISYETLREAIDNNNNNLVKSKQNIALIFGKNITQLPKMHMKKP